jgi:hypothetical protein
MGEIELAALPANGMRRFLENRWQAFSQTPFGFLVRLFVGRMFHGGGEPGGEDLNLGVGVMLILLAMPGMLVSLLMFEKYGSLIRFLRGERAFDPFTATAPDEYFFIVLSLVVTGVAALWRWDAIFLDRRDYMNLVPQPISLRAIFSANLVAILVLAGLFTVVVNAASLVLYPIAVVGSQNSFAVLFRFAAGHVAAVFLASAFSFFTVFALAGLVMAMTPAKLFSRISLSIRFVLAVVLLTLFASSFTVPYLLTKLSVAEAHRVSVLPPVSFLGVARTVWLGGRGSFSASMARAALFSLAGALFAAGIAYALSFRRNFLRIPELADAGPLPRTRRSVSLLAPVHRWMFRSPEQRACYLFAGRTLLRSDAHLQIVLGFAALGIVAAGETLASAPHLPSFLQGRSPSEEFLALPFILSYCVLVGIRFAFEVPADLRANWIFRFWLNPDRKDDARAVARRVLLAFSLPWLAPASFLVTLRSWGWRHALIHTAILIACSAVLVELLLVRFRKIPFTCSYPPFQSHSGLIGAAYLFGFFIFTSYMPALDRASLVSPVQMLWFVPLLGIVLAALRGYRKQMLDMDKQLIFEEMPASIF